MSMRKEFEKKSQEQARARLDIIGEQFILDSQINTMQTHQDELYNNRDEYQATFEQQRYETEKQAKETLTQRLQLDQEIASNNMMIEREEEESYRQCMHIQKGKIMDDLNKHRHERDLKQIEQYRDYKQQELNTLIAEREKTDAAYMAMGELQGLITEAKQYTDDIEVMHVDHGFLNIRIKELDDACEYLHDTKEKLEEEKKKTDEANEDLEKQLKAKEEANQKRLIAKLQRDRNPQIKELIQKEEMQAELNEDINNKFREEKEKHDELLD